MRKRVKVRPGKGQSLIGFLMGVAFCFVGISLLVQAFSPFVVIWTLLSALTTFRSGYNLFSKEGGVSRDITIEDDYYQNNMEHSRSPEERMKELTNLYYNGMITEKEYNDKRTQILNEI